MSKPKIKQTKLEQEMAENQVAFRNINQKLPKDFEKLIEIAKEEDQLNLVEIPTGLLYFTCECSDEDCRHKVRMTLKTFQRIHRKPDEFCVVKGHIVPKVEDVVEEHRGYDVVKKKVVPPQDVQGLHPTPIHFD